ncbi:MAG TPA: PASTA domain-containing protein, partial [Gaiellaceae bacterium]|nr:PASTA domain-containing protein [Gaiellaceae bacterium]
ASTLTAPSGLASVTVTPAAWPSLPSAWDFMVLRVDLAPPAPVVGTGLLPGTQMVEVTANWALAGTPVTEFQAPIDIVIPNPSGEVVVPAISQDGSTWRVLSQVSGSLPAGQADGWYRDGSGAVHILTRHLAWFALLRDNEAPTAPGHLAGVVADDGLTLRWIPGTDASGQLGNVVLFVNGEAYQEFETTQFEVKLGVFEPGDTRRFTLVQLDAAGNASAHTQTLRAVPVLAGKSVEQATAELAAAGFGVGRVHETLIPGSVTGTIVEPAGMHLAVEASTIDLVVAIATGVPQTRLVFAVAGAKSLKLVKRTQIPVRISVSKPADVTATLFGVDTKRLYTWRLNVKAGANLVKLTLPRQIRRPGTYTLTWVARSGTETIRRTVRLKLVGPKLAQVKPKRQAVEIVLAGETPPKGALQPGLKGTGTRVVATADPNRTFALVASTARDVGIVVVDVDSYGVGFVRDLHTVFPTLRLIAISRKPILRGQSVRAGAVRALPRNVTAKQLAKAIAKISSR